MPKKVTKKAAKKAAKKVVPLTKKQRMAEARGFAK